MRKIIFSLCFLIISTVANAQIGTTFWFVAPEAAFNHGDRPIYMRISTFEQAATITINQPANPSFAPITTTIAANRTQSINLTTSIDLIENNPANQILGKGILIESTTNITAYYEVASVVNPAMFPLKGKNALGTDFLVPSQNSAFNQVGSEAIDIVATENNTSITIRPTTNIIGHAANIPFTITLQKGQTYSARAIGTDAATTLAGTSIASDKPIAVTISDDSIRFPATPNGWDLIGDQLTPISLLGTAHIVVKGFAGISEEVYILATEDNTIVAIGAASVILQKAETYKHLLTENAIYINAAKPIYVYHISGQPNEAGSAIIPHINCTGSKEMRFIRTSSGDFALMLLTKNGSQSSFSINGNTNLITASDFVVVPNTNNEWVSMRKEFTTSQIEVDRTQLVKNTQGVFHLGILNDLGGSSEYGFFSDFSNLDLGKDTVKVCENDFAVLDAGAGKDAYLWSTGATTQTIQVTTAGEYSVRITNDACVLYDTVQVISKPLPIVAINPISEEYCKNTTAVSLSGNPTGGVFKIDGTIVTQINPSLLVAGEHTLTYTYTNSEDCSKTVEKTLRILPLPVLAFSDLKTDYCVDSPTFDLKASPIGGTFKIDGTTTNQFNPALLGVGDYEVRYDYTDAKGCANFITQIVNIRPLPTPVFVDLEMQYCVNETPFAPQVNPTSGTLRINNQIVTQINPANLGVGEFEIFYSYQDNFACQKTISQTFEILPLPELTFTNLANEYCLESTPVLLSANPSGGIFEINGLAKNIFSPIELGIGTHQVKYTYTNANQCTNSITQNVVVNPPPALQFSNLNDGYCVEASAFNLQATPAGGTFKIKDQTVIQLNPSELGVGFHFISYTYQDAKGCQNSINKIIEIVSKPLPMLLPADTIFVCPSNKEGIFLQATGGEFFEWNTRETSQNINIREPGTYTVVVSNGYDCEVTNTIKVFGKCEPAFFLPTAFSPNGDNLNDLLKIIGKDFYKLNLRIYNRWGEIVFVGRFKEDTWDGTLNGRNAPEGIYQWSATYENILFPEQKFKKMGKLVIVR